MELRDYVAIVRQAKRFLVTVVVLATVLTAALTVRRPTRYEGSLTMTVFQDVPAQTQGAAPYQFDSFYTLQAAGLYADQVKGRFADPGFVATVFAEANAPLPVERISRLSRVFLARKQEHAQVQAEFEDVDEARVRSVLASAGAELRRELSALQSTGALPAMRLTVGEPVVLAYRSSVAVASVVAAVASVLVALALIFVWEFARPKS